MLRLTGEHAHSPLPVLDDDPDRWGQTLDGRRVVGGLDLVTEYDDHGLLVCAGKGATRRLLTERLAALGVDEARSRRSCTRGCTCRPAARSGAAASCSRES